MGDPENALPPSKKRAAGRELTRDNPGLDDDESNEQESGSFQRASDEVLANRRIVKVRRNPLSSVPASTPSSNPFAGIQLVPPASSLSVSSESKANANVSKTKQDEVVSEAVTTGEKADNRNKGNVSEKGDVDETTDKEKIGKAACHRGEEQETAKESVEAGKDTEKSSAEDHKQSEEAATETAKEASVDENCSNVEERVDAVKAREEVGSDKKESGNGSTVDEEKKDNGNENAEKNTDGCSLSSFQQLSSSKNAFTDLAGTGFSSTSFSFGSTPSGSVASASFSFGFSSNGNSSLFNASTTSIAAKTEGNGIPSMQEVQVETGEENERVAFAAGSILFEFLEGGWKERGKGEVRVNVSTTGTEKARLVMRAKGNYRLVLNASIFPEMKLTDMDKRGITFACMNSVTDGKEGLCTFALKFKDASVREEFREAVTALKDKTPAAAVKTPENSPKVANN